MSAEASIPARRVETPDRIIKFIEGDHPKGTFFWSNLDRREGAPEIWVHMPYDAAEAGRRHSWHSFPVNPPGEEGGPGWDWDGDLDKPTLSPSIPCGVGHHTDWHGHLRKGVLERA